MARQKRELIGEDGSSRGFYSEDNRVNDLTGREWVFWTRSVITKPYPPNLQHALRNQHGGQKPPDLCADLLRVFTKEGQVVLDPFMGVGGTLLGASRSGRRAVGIEINPEWTGIYREVCAREGIEIQEVLEGDAAQVLPRLSGRVFDCVLTDVPYWSMDTVSRSRGTWKRVGRPAAPVRASKLSAFHSGSYRTKEEWLQRMQETFRLAAGLLKADGYLLSFIGDMYRDNEYHCLSAELAAVIARIPEMVWKANLVWYDVSKKLHLYGYQYSYIPSLIHQNVLVFRREPARSG
ncbi:MAG TPA: DNA methyltransferase [Spirochaetia bacterium]|nr:DNA methyltransferase [Spirochaetia bacterium]